MDEQRLIEELAEAITASRNDVEFPAAYAEGIRAELEAEFLLKGRGWLARRCRHFGITVGDAPELIAVSPGLPVECSLCGSMVRPAAVKNKSITANEHGWPVTIGCAFDKTADTCSLARSIVTQIREEEVVS